MPTVTLSQLQSRVYSRLDNNALLYTASEVTAAINEQIRVINLITGYIQTSVLVPGSSRPNQQWYNVPAGILVPLRVQFEQTVLEKYSLTNMGMIAPNWLTENTANTGAPVSHWTSVGLQKFAIHPADSVGGNDILVTGIAEPVLLVSGSDTISFPNEYAEALEDMAVVTLVMKESGTIFTQASVMYQKFISKMKQFQRFENLRWPAYWIETVQNK